MIDILHAGILGIVEGVTEFLPISSTGHLIIVNQWIAFGPELTNMFDVVIQLGAILAVVVYFWNRLWPFQSDKAAQMTSIGVWKKTLVAVIPALVLGKIFGDSIEEKLFNPTTVAFALIVGGLLLILIEKRKPTEKTGSLTSIGQMTYTTAILIGLAQCLAMIPGTSRAAATIVGGMFLGATRTVSTEFSFFLAIPTMAAASGYTLLKHYSALNAANIGVLATGFIVSFLVAWAVIAVFMKYIQKHDFALFGWYRIALGAVVLALLK
jgi:undecaprenyl-diphosphatase